MIIFHIGSWKTGTTALQYYLRCNKSVLSEKGVFFLDQKDPSHENEFRPLFKSAFKAWKRNQGDAQELIVKSVDKFLEISMVDAYSSVIHSWEGALGHPLNSGAKTLYHPDFTALWLARLNAKHSVKISLTIRDQLSFIQSMYAQEVRKGRFSGDFGEFLNKKIPDDIRWSSVINPFLKNGLESNFRVIPYEISLSSSEDYYHQVLWSTISREDLSNISIKNRSLSARAVEIMRLTNHLLSKSERVEFERFLVNVISEGERGFNFLSEKDEFYIKSRIKDDNLKIQEQFFPKSYN